VSKLRCRGLQLLVGAGLTALLVACYPHNQAPNTPSPPIGPDQAGTYSYEAYRAVSTDPDGDTIYLGFDWNDGYYYYNETTWSSATASGDTCQSCYHTWYSAGVHEVRVKAVDVHGLSSGWSAPLTVTVHSTDR